MQMKKEKHPCPWYSTYQLVPGIVPTSSHSEGHHHRTQEALDSHPPFWTETGNHRGGGGGHKAIGQTVLLAIQSFAVAVVTV
jgi:hypothetical protein